MLEIAAVLERYKTTIRLELARKRGIGLRPKESQPLVNYRCKKKLQPRIAKQTWKWVERFLKEEWSHKQIIR